jgi:hypothetical protein
MQVHANVCICWHETCIANNKNRMRRQVIMRPEKERTISYRITEEVWNEIEKRAPTAGESSHQWARSALLEKLIRNDELTRADRFLFHHLVRAQYLITQGFQMLADQSLTSEAWQKLRVNAKHRVSELVESALASHTEKSAQKVSIGDSTKT